MLSYPLKKKSTLNSKEDKLFLETTVTGHKASVLSPNP